MRATPVVGLPALRRSTPSVRETSPWSFISSTTRQLALRSDPESRASGGSLARSEADVQASRARARIDFIDLSCEDYGALPSWNRPHLELRYFSDPGWFLGLGGLGGGVESAAGWSERVRPDGGADIFRGHGG